MFINYDKLPEGMRDVAKRYIENGINPGHFMTAVLCNDLVESVARADNENMRRLDDWVRWMYNDIPSSAYGSKEKMVEWMKKGGLSGETEGNN